MWKRKNYMSFLDLENNYDAIDRIFFWRKLLDEHEKYRFVKALQSMYSVVKSTVYHNGPTYHFKCRGKAW